MSLNLAYCESFSVKEDASPLIMQRNSNKMQLKNYSLVVLAAMLLAFLNAQSSHAASITYDTNASNNISFNKVPYTQSSKVGESWVVQPTLLQRGGTPGLRRLLQNYFPDWTFLIAPSVTGNSSLKGEFRIKQYYACGNLTDCGNPSTNPIVGGVGALLEVSFIPGQGDPQLNSEYKWIQRVVSNHSELPGPYGSYGLKEDRIDNHGTTSNPYYFPITSNSSNTTSFYDRPYRGDPQDNHSWDGELFLVRETGPKTVLIYDGISWGWRNQTKPNPACSTTQSQCPPPPPNCTGDSGGGGCTINSASTASVPESASGLGLLVFGAWGIVKALKIKKDK